MEKIYQQVLESFKKDYTVSGEFDVKLLDYIIQYLLFLYLFIYSLT